MERKNLILIKDAFDKTMLKPRRKKLTLVFFNSKKLQWNDFAAFIKEKYPKVISFLAIKSKNLLTEIIILINK
ncbi:hypothetical protein AAEX28_15280 [Lentisphaerota bacterium WC36G]|nr:hypothetical protein LJT99_02050 [Lentisphaerae bacterium WC36]